MSAARTTASTLVAAALGAALIAPASPAGGAPARDPDIVQRGAASEPTIERATVIPAPIGKRGGITSPYTWCSDAEDPETTWKLESLQTGRVRTFEWALPAPLMYLPRVRTGRYVSTTTVTCGATTKTRTQRLKVGEKTHKDTVSRAEWRKVKRGMTRAKVAKVLRTNGRNPSRYAGSVTRTYDMMKFWSWSLIEFRKGRVTVKYWNVGHD